MKNFVYIMILVTIGVSLYFFLKDDRSKSIRQEMTALIGDMNIAPEWKEEAKGIFDSVHEKAFEAALDVTQRLGQKFDDDTYYDKVFAMMQQSARDEGKAELAEKLAEQKELFTLHVSER